MKRIKIKNTLFIIIIFMILPLISIMNVHALTFALGTTHGTVDPQSLIVTEKKKLIISNVPEEDVLTAYKILDVYFNESSNSLTYEFTSDFKNYLSTSNDYHNLTVDGYTKLTSGNAPAGDTNSLSTLDKLASGYAAYVKEYSISGTDMTTNNTNKIASLSLGSYLITPKTTSKIYAVMVGNLSLFEENGQWTSSDQTIIAKVNEPGIITKSLSGNKETDSFYIGNEITYNITGSVPKYPTNATNKKYIIKDTMDNGLTFTGLNSVSITDGTKILNVNVNNGNVTDNANNIVANITENGQVITFDFHLDYINSTEITISYKAKLNDSAILGGEGNKNQAKLIYANNPYTESTYESEESSTIAYTYGIEILKYSETNKNTVLENAIFDIYNDSSLTNKIGTMTTNADGLAQFKGIPEGIYYLKETKAPSGYRLLNKPVSINVANEGATVSPQNTGYYYQEISNSKNIILPFTGGMGTYAYTIVGLLIIIVAVMIFIIYRKKREEKDKNEK